MTHLRSYACQAAPLPGSILESTCVPAPSLGIFVSGTVEAASLLSIPARSEATLRCHQQSRNGFV